MVFLYFGQNICIEAMYIRKTLTSAVKFKLKIFAKFREKHLQLSPLFSKVADQCSKLRKKSRSIPDVFQNQLFCKTPVNDFF